MESNSKIYVAGHTGLVGSSIVRLLKKEGFNNLILKTHAELDLTVQSDVFNFFRKETPEYVFVCAAKVGGVLINDERSAEFLYINMMIAMNVMHAAYSVGVKKLLYMGSSCIYPKLSEQPIKETSLLTGELEKTNEAYALAKIAGVKMCEFYNKQYETNFVAIMPSNAYGPGDNYDLKGAHVVPALIRKFHEAKVNADSEVIMWGTGTPVREFIYIDDIADAALFIMRNYDENSPINVGTGLEYTIRELADIIKDVVGYKGEIINDLTKPDGTPRKLVDSSKIFELGWRPKVNFNEGITITYKDYMNNIEKYNAKIK